MTYDICCAGHMCTDVLVRPVDNLPDKGKLMLVDSVCLRTGGCAMNTAIDLSKLEAKTAMAGKVGGDSFGAFMKSALSENGVDVSGLKTGLGTDTSVSVVAISSDGERSILHSLGANRTLCFEDIDLSIVEKSRYLFVGGAFLLPAFDGAGMAKLFKFAGEKGVVTAMDTAWDATGQWLETLSPALVFLDWFLPSIEEAEQMTGTGDERRQAEFFLDSGVKNVAIKMGRDGCYVRPGDKKGVYYDALAVEVLDTSGAGDAWCAGFLAALARGMDIGYAAMMGNATGALCVTEIGTTSGVRSFEETAAFLRDQTGVAGPAFHSGVE